MARISVALSWAMDFLAWMWEWIKTIAYVVFGVACVAAALIVVAEFVWLYFGLLEHLERR